MRILYRLILKEFKQIFRNKIMLPVIFIIPFIQTIILVYSATLELKNSDITIIDMDKSMISANLISKFQASPFFKVELMSYNEKEISDALLKDKTKAILIIPKDFEKNLRSGIPVKILLNLNAIDSQSSGLINIYVGQTVLGIFKDFKPFLSKIDLEQQMPKVDIRPSYWYNQNLNFKFFMLPGILTILVSMIGIFLTSFNIVREKEMGTIEQINVTPIEKWQFLTGKLLPFVLIGIFDLTIGLLFGIFMFDLPFEGSVYTMFIFTILYLIAGIGIGLLIADFSNTLQQSMFMLLFFFLIFILMGGTFTAVESMPDWAQAINVVNPMYYYMRVVRSILLKGSGVLDLIKDFWALLVYGITTVFVAVWAYRKTV
ncbi:MAG: ABC transporter permease [Bacteroidales bacterium]|nr:ABC transporter permease [Bacteroidales bacterium]